jgi:hypothetical protein
MSHSIEETRKGTYTVPFTTVQYGAFVMRADGWRFTAAGYDADDARRKAINYYEEMNKYPHNNMDMDALNDIQIRQRVVTYDVWTPVE